MSQFTMFMIIGATICGVGVLSILIFGVRWKETLDMWRQH